MADVGLRGDRRADSTGLGVPCELLNRLAEQLFAAEFHTEAA